MVLLEDATTQLGNQFRDFVQAVNEIETLETEGEAEKRTRSQKAKKAKQSQTAQAAATGEAGKESGTGNRKRKAKENGKVKAKTKGKDKEQESPAPGLVGGSGIGEPVVELNTNTAPVTTSTSTPNNIASAVMPVPAMNASRPLLRRVKLKLGPPPPGYMPSPPITQPQPNSTLAVSAPPPSAVPLKDGLQVPPPPSSSSFQFGQPTPATLETFPSPETAAQPTNPDAQLAGGVAVDTVSTDSSTQEKPVKSAKAASGKVRVSKKLNIATIKFHTIGHYPSTIRTFGPSDLYTTEWVRFSRVYSPHSLTQTLRPCRQGESFHRSPKAWFKNTSKRYIRKELSRHERKRARLNQAKQRILSRPQSQQAKRLKEQRLAARDPNIHHHIGASTQAPVYLNQFSLSESPLSTDLACVVRHLKFLLEERELESDTAVGRALSEI